LYLLFEITLNKSKQVAEIITGTPPVTVAGMTLFGYSIADWVQVLAVVWLLLQIGHFLYTKIREEKPNEQSK
jgi:hypothetical protein